jgi:hypothetical protein
VRACGRRDRRKGGDPKHLAVAGPAASCPEICAVIDDGLMAGKAKGVVVM